MLHVICVHGIKPGGNGSFRSNIPVRTLGRFGPIPFRSGRFGLGRFGPILEVGRFGPVLVGRFGPLYFIYFLGNKFFLLARLI